MPATWPIDLTHAVPQSLAHYRRAATEIALAPCGAERSCHQRDTWARMIVRVTVRILRVGPLRPRHADVPSASEVVDGDLEIARVVAHLEDDEEELVVRHAQATRMHS